MLDDVRVAVGNRPHVRGHVAPGGDPFVGVVDEHARQLRVGPLAETLDVVERDPEEDTFEHALPVGGSVEVARAVRGQGGGDQPRVVGAQGIVDERELAVTEVAVPVEEVEPPQDAALLRCVPIPVQRGDLVAQRGAGERQRGQQQRAYGVVDRPSPCRIVRRS